MPQTERRRVQQSTPTKTGQTTQAAGTKAPAFREDALTLISPRRVGSNRPPVLSIPGDGRLTLNTAALYKLSPGKQLDAIRLYLSQKDEVRYLVIRPAPKGAPDALKLHRTGSWSKTRWPVVMNARAAGALSQLGLIERCKFVGEHNQEKNWLVFDLRKPEPFSETEGRDPMGDAVVRWMKHAKRPCTLRLEELFGEVLEAAKRDNVACPFKRPAQLGAYLRKHAEDYTHEGLTMAGLGTIPVVTLE